MSGLKNTVQRFANASMFKGFKSNSELRQEKRHKRQVALDKIYSSAEMPDPEELRRKERRKAAGKRGSRVKNILTDDDRETLG